MKTSLHNRKSYFPTLPYQAAQLHSTRTIYKHTQDPLSEPEWWADIVMIHGSGFIYKNV